MDPLESQITLSDAANIIAAQASKIDDEIIRLFDLINENTKSLLDCAPNQDHYNTLLSVEYLFVRIRIMTETEYVKCKKLLNDATTPVPLKAFFNKRVVFLSEVSAKLTVIRDDLNVIQRMQWSQSQRYIK